MGREQRFSVSSAPAVCFHSNPTTQGSSALSLGEGCWGGYHTCLLLPSSPPPASASGEEHRVAAAIRVQAGPDLWPCLTLVPTKPCDETRPQERGFNSVIASWNSNSATSPKTGCAWRAGCARRGPNCAPRGPGCSLPPPLSPQAATPSLSLTTWKDSPLPGPSTPMAWLSVQHQPQEWWAMADPGGPSSDL